MKNSLNLVLVILFFIVLGCSCPNMDEIQKKSDSTSPTTTSSPGSTDSPAKEKAGLTLEKYNKIKDGMSYKEVSDILGSEGTETMSSGSGRYKVTSYKWDGDAFQFVSCVFTNDKLTSKVQANLK